GRFKVPAASLVSMEVVFMLLWVALHDAVVIPLAQRATGGPGGLTQLQRMGVAPGGAGPGRCRAGRAVEAQFVLVAGSDVFCGIAQQQGRRKAVAKQRGGRQWNGMG